MSRELASCQQETQEPRLCWCGLQEACRGPAPQLGSKYHERPWPGDPFTLPWSWGTRSPELTLSLTGSLLSIQLSQHSPLLDS